MSDDRLADARSVTVEELGEGRWRVAVLDETDDELAAFGLGVEGEWDPDVVDHVEFVVRRLGLTFRGARPWASDELDRYRAAVLPPA